MRGRIGAIVVEKYVGIGKGGLIVKRVLGRLELTGGVVRHDGFDEIGVAGGKVGAALDASQVATRAGNAGPLRRCASGRGYRGCFIVIVRGLREERAATVLNGGLLGEGSNVAE